MTDAVDHENRQLAAVVFLDMVGYSAWMQVSEARAQAAVDTLWNMAAPLLAQHGGHEWRRFGDGMLLTFPTTVAAARCHLQLLQALAEHNRDLVEAEKIQARVGIHIGEISSREGEIFGDGVNIASRLVALAPPGGIALSPHVRDQLDNTLDQPLKSLGIKSLKNIKAPLEVFCLQGPDCSSADVQAAAAEGNAPGKLWRFGLASFDQRALELSVSGNAVELPREAIAILQCLLTHAGEVVPSDELCIAAGDGVSASELDDHILTLRQALRDDSQQQIKTLAGIGYRLAVAASVEAAPSATLTQFDFKPGDRPPQRPLWKLEKLLGQGGHGEVWLARHEKTQEARVYKFGLDASKLSSLKREITLSRILHSTARNEYFIRVLDWNLEIAPFFIECEYGGDEDLSAWALAQGGLKQVALQQRLDLAVQIAEALAAAHSVGVLHKDLKPGNVLISQTPGQAPQVKLADFGSGAVLDNVGLEAADITRMGFTRSVALGSGSTSGTPLYFAPELFAGQTATVQADVYALGVILYQLLVADFRKPLSTGWESDIEDELLREDIAAASHGNPLQRLADATSFARRLRDLDSRRQTREAERQAQAEARRVELEAEQAKQQVAQLRSRRRWSFLVVAALAVGLALAVHQQRRAVAAAKTSQAVADFLSKDLFSVVGDKPLRDLSVQELLETASENLEQRDEQLPEVAAQLHAALGEAFFTVENFVAAEKHLNKALVRYEQDGALKPDTAIRIASMLLSFVRIHPEKLPEQRARFEGLLNGAEKTLGELHPQILDFRYELAAVRYVTGDWVGASNELRNLISKAETKPLALNDWLGRARAHLGEWLIRLGEFSSAETELRKTLNYLNSVSETSPMTIAQARFFLSWALMEQEAFEESQLELEKARIVINQWARDDLSGLNLELEKLQGQILLRQKKYSAALKLIEPTVRKILSLEHINRYSLGGTSLALLATAYVVNERPTDAELAWRDALQKQAGSGRLGNANTISMRIDLADLLRRTQRFQESHAQLALIDKRILHSIGLEHPTWAQLKRVEGLLALDEGQLQAAHAALIESERIFNLKYGPQHYFSRRARNEVALVKIR